MHVGLHKGEWAWLTMQGASKAANWIVGWQPELGVESEARTHGLSVS